MNESTTISSSDALIIVDPQKDFVFPDGALYVKGVHGDEKVEDVIVNIVLLGKKPFGYVAITMDRHPETHIEYTIHPKHCVEGTSGQYMIDEIAHEFCSDSVDILHKGGQANVIVYSVAFSPLFDAHLYRMRMLGIKRVFLVGWAYDFCVGESSIAYKGQGFEALIVTDAVRSVDEVTAFDMDSKLAVYKVDHVRMNQLR